jgi:alkylation response protein AidB-like acyl-CoA dehydrogenase
MAIRLFASESMMYRTAGLIQARLEGLDMSSDTAGIRTAEALEEYLIECSINKIYGSETEDYVVDEEVQIHGGYGYIYGNHPELAYRNARINRIWEGTNEINRLVIVNTFLRRAAKGTFDLVGAFQRGSEETEKLDTIRSDKPTALDAQKGLMEIAKRIALLVFGMAYQRHGKNLREEQELIGMISEMIIEIYATESALLRSQKLLDSKGLERADIPVRMTKVLLHDSIEKIGSLATRALEAVEEGQSLERHLIAMRRLAVSPPMNTVGLRRDIAQGMIRYGRYAF